MLHTAILATAAIAFVSSPVAAADWQPVAAANGDRVEIDKSRIMRTGPGKTTAWSRLVLGRDLKDAAGSYTAIQAMNRYDCETRSFTTVKRVYMQGEKALRDESVGAPKEMAAEPGSVDDLLLSEVCKPRTVGEMQKVAGEAARQAEAAQTGKAGVMYADMRSAAGTPRGKVLPVADAAHGAEKPAEKPAEKQRFIDLPKIDKSAVEDPHKPPVKPVETKAAETKPAAKPVEKHSPAAAPVVRHELERQYATSGPRRAARKEAVVEHKEIHWSYEGEGGPANWGKLRPNFGLCAAGKRQSPIDLREGIIKVELEPIKFAYQPSLVRVSDNGHTIQVTVGEGSSITVMGHTYDLVQFHFHRPSEERLNGRAFDMVVHLVHKDADGNLAVIAVLLERGVEHPAIQTVWNYMPLEAGLDVEPPGVTIDPGHLLPPPDKRAYYTYMGSLTTPPCSEGVLWMVFRQPVQVSKEQISVFSRLYRNNARPVQPVNNRLVKESR